MTVKSWSDDILLVELEDEPQFSEDLQATMDRLADQPRHVVLNFSQVGQINSSNISQLLRVRKKTIETDRRLKLCCMNDGAWSVMLTTGLEKIFSFADDVPTALAGLQLGASGE